MNNVLIHREIGIDTGHRVPDHGSKCRSCHGHRYRIIATCLGEVVERDGNEENGMVIDFGNIKQYMMDTFDAIFDHGFVVYKGDKMLMNMFFPGEPAETVYQEFSEDLNSQHSRYISATKGGKPTVPIEPLRAVIDPDEARGQKIIVTKYVPTAENLAKHMYELLAPIVKAHYNNDVKLVNIRLYETPNGFVDYPGTLSLSMLA